MTQLRIDESNLGTSMVIVYCAPQGEGWSPIHRMVSLAAELFEAELVVLHDPSPHGLQRLAAALWGRRRHSQGEACLVVCPSPSTLPLLFLLEGWRKRFRYLAAWIIDSFWTDWIPRTIRWARPFDQFFVTTEEDIPIWERLTRTPTRWLPWGSDVLRFGGADAERKWDLTRVGRQPPEWNDDQVTQRDCAARKLQFHGRPPTLEDAKENQEMLMNLYRQSKFLLAFSNKANPTSYTHCVREYLTGRWVDALACGCIVAGIPPREPSIQQLLWSGATLDLDSVERDAGLEQIEAAVRAWNPESAFTNYQRSLERLDWRWRFAQIADACGVSPTRLRAEIGEVERTLGQGCAPHR